MVGRQLELINEKLNEKQILLPVYFISINPKQDTLKKKKTFLKRFSSGSGWNFLGTDESTTRKLLAELNMGFSDSRNMGHALHTMSLALLNSEGEILELIPVLSDKTEVAVAKIQAALQENLHPPK